MKIFKSLFFLTLLGGLVTFLGCKDEELSPYLEHETAVHGFGRIAAGSPADFVAGATATPIKIAFNWNSIDGLNTVSKIEFFLFFDEAYQDLEGNDRTARHGGDYADYTKARGKAFKVLEGAAVPANRATIEFTISQDEVYQLYKNSEFDYGKGKVNVFTNPDKPARTATAPFTKGDAFRLGWIIYTADGRKFDAWGTAICVREFPNSSCYQDWKVICTSDLAGEMDYKQYDMVKGKGTPGSGDPFPGEITGTVTWTAGAAGKYTSTDITFGQWAFVWNDNPVIKPVIIDACNVITLDGTDQYGVDTYKYNFLEINGATAKIRWVNTYGDAGTVELTRKDGKNWPPLKGG